MEPAESKRTSDIRVSPFFEKQEKLRKNEENQGFASTTTLSDTDVNRYQAIMESIRNVFGGYRNWHTAILDPDGTDQENAAVFELLTKVRFRYWDEDIRDNGWTTEKAKRDWHARLV